MLLPCYRSQDTYLALAQVADGASCSTGAVCNVKRNNFVGSMEAALHEKPPPGVEPTFTGETEAQLTMLAWSKPPKGYGRWNLRLLADKLVKFKYVESIAQQYELSYYMWMPEDAMLSN